MTLERSFKINGFNYNSHESWADYADLLDTETLAGPVPDELRGDAVSRNGVCFWDKKKAFINKYKHEVSFEDISLFFGLPVPGHKIWFIVEDEQGGGVSPWGKDEREWVGAEKNHSFYYIIRVAKENAGGLVRLISARLVSGVEFREACIDNGVLSSMGVVKKLLQSASYIRSVRKYGFGRLRHSFLSGVKSFDSAVDILVSSGRGYDKSKAELIVNSWFFFKV